MNTNLKGTTKWKKGIVKGKTQLIKIWKPDNMEQKNKESLVANR